MPSRFPEDASLVLIGMRCAGKSSLASIAAKALHWTVVDEKLHFQRATGYSVGGYIERHGIGAYCAREVLILKSILEENERRRIVVCSSSCVETQAGRDLLRQYLPAVPVVHVMRDRAVLQRYLESKWKGDVARILRSQEPVYLACSNLTFFNTDDASTEPVIQGTPSGIFEAVGSPSDRPMGRSLSLKRVESDFLRFLGNVYGQADGGEAASMNEGPDAFNYAIQLPFGDLKHPGISQESITCSADVLYVSTDTLLRGYDAKDSPDQTWWEYLVDQLAFLRRHASQPILYHAVPPEDGSAATERDYFDVVQLGLRVGAELVAIDLRQDQGRIEAISQRKGQCKLVGWFHDPDPATTGGWTGQDRLSRYDKAVATRCDVVHLTQPAITRSDNRLAQWFAQSASMRGPLPISAYNTGRLGRPSRCFNQALTVVRHPGLARDEADAITIPEAQAALFSSFACEPLGFGVMGANVRYSLAPVIQNAAFGVYGMPHEYTIKQTDTLDTLEVLVRDDYFGGLGLSSPFKTSVIPRLRYMSAEARAIGAVNTIMPIRHWDDSASPSAPCLSQQRNRGGPVMGLYGENTDWKAIKVCTQRYLSPANAVAPLSTALVIGAGGMARAAVYAMVRSGIRRICIYNRTHEHAVNLAHHFEALCNEERPRGDREGSGRQAAGPTAISVLRTLDEPWPGDLRFPTVIVNCSPIPGDTITVAPPAHRGSVGPEPAVSIPDAWLGSPTGGVYMELAYNSLASSPELLRICSEENGGWIGVAGLEIFIEVAFAQFEFWTGRRAPQRLMKERLSQHLQQMQDDVML